MTYNFVDLSNKKIGRWTFVKFHGYGKWLVRCDCGKEKILYASNIKKGNSVSCGCYRREHHPRKTHGLTRTPVYFAWRNMLNRCYNKKVDSFKSHGARGIKVCNSWKNSFEDFYKDIGFTYKPGLSLDRINNNGNYEPGNCRWVNNEIQMNNKRTTHFFEVDGKKMTIKQWAEEVGMNKNTLANRVYALGWSIKKAINTPLIPYSKRKWRKSNNNHSQASHH